MIERTPTGHLAEGTAGAGWEPAQGQSASRV